MATTTQVAIESIALVDLQPIAGARSTSKDARLSPDTTPSMLTAQIRNESGSALSETGRRVFEVATPVRPMSTFSRLLLMFFIINSNLVQMISNYVTVAGGYSLSTDLGHKTGPGQSNWMASAYPLTQGAFVLVSGRLGQIYGYQRVLLIGGAILILFSLLNGFTKRYDLFIAARAFSGIGGGLIMPNAVALITSTIPPGKARNVAMGFFAASAPIGGWIGAIISGVFLQYTSWTWIFFFLAIFSAATFVPLIFLFPKEQPVDKGGSIDYFGAVLGLGSLILFNFVWNQAPSSGWNTWYEIVCLVLSVAMFVAFIFWERRAKNPVMPLNLFKAPTFSAVVAVSLCNYMCYCTFQWYMIAWQQLIRDWTVLETAIGWCPFLVGSVLAVALAAYLIPRLAAQYILAIGVVLVAIANVLLATQPVHQSYWVRVFPAIALSGICPDFVYTASQVIASNSVGRKHQGVAGSLMGTLNLYGGALGMGFAGTIESQISKGGNTILGYRAALYFGFALAIAGLVIDLLFVRMPKDEREGWELAEDIEDANQPQVGRATGVEHGLSA